MSNSTPLDTSASTVATMPRTILRGDQRLDFLYAHRPIARQFLRSARELTTSFGTLHVVNTEALIAFKLQGWLR